MRGRLPVDIRDPVPGQRLPLFSVANTSYLRPSSKPMPHEMPGIVAVMLRLSAGTPLITRSTRNVQTTGPRSTGPLVAAGVRETAVPVNTVSARAKF